ncbi:MAG: hypothetical protein EA402_06620 [Planctomycetota bacterium]|nr:MAG: hypothetical protein EA402_06620 [Planctomycetota bacterium]
MICLPRSLRLVFLSVLLLPALAEETIIHNPLRADAEAVPLRLGEVQAKQGGVVSFVGEQLIPYQWEAVPGGYQRWLLLDLPGASQLPLVDDHEVVLHEPFASPLSVAESDGVLTLSNGVISVRLPATATANQPPPPILGIRHGEGPWLGEGAWQGAPELQSFSSQVLGTGPVQITVLQSYQFSDGSSLRLRLRLRPGRDFLEVEERIDLPAGSAWSFDPSAGNHDWQPSESLFTQHGGGAGQPMNQNVQEGTLLPGQSRMGDILVFLLPRWSQAMDDGWLAAAADASLAVGLITVRAGQWYWPHEGRIAAVLRDQGGSMRFHLPGIRDGARMWWLRAAARDSWDTGTMRALVMRHAMADLDKLNRYYILDGFEPGQRGSLPNPFDGNQVNPTGMWRQQARREWGNMDRPGGFGDLLWAQGVLDPDYFGTPWYGWSVQNPNFWSDMMQRPAARLARLYQHHRFDELSRLMQLSLRADLHHSVTLPGGAGQECPGYQAHAIEIWQRIAEATADKLGFDIREWPWFFAAQDFLVRSSQPDGGRHRRMLPTGDTHPTRGGPRRVDLAGYDPSNWESEEFPGFGIILRHRAGTDRETYVAFKSGPNRGHYHGDQLALHWGSDARPLMVDHHASYSPRVGQEHMHNRLSFGTAEMPWAVMDGYERVLGLVTHPFADIAMGEVASERLRRMPKLPPEEWDQRWDVYPLGGELRYQRSVVLLKGLARDALVICDSWEAPKPLTVSYNAHVRGDDATLTGDRAQVDNALVVQRIAPEEAEFSRLDWSHENGGGESTVGLRWTIEAERGRFITVHWPGDDPPPIQAVEGGVQIGETVVRFGVALDGGSGPAVQVLHQGAEQVALAEADYARSQGEIGLFVPDAGYPFGPIPTWLSKQRLARPDWAQNLPGLLDPLEDF